jgi:sugar transferase EpsL
MLYRLLFKPIADRCLAAIALLFLWPIVFVVALGIRLHLGRPVVFRQVRIGLLGEPFVFLKFRTMTDERDAAGTLLPDDRRLTGFGRFLRAGSLDELPQLWNVLKGEMSLIGPRPLLPEYLSRYSAVQRRRHEVMPGITGLAQVKGRNSLTWEDKFDLDVQYVDSCNVRLDVRILLMTLISVVRREGISQAGHATMPEFLGSSPSKQEAARR